MLTAFSTALSALSAHSIAIDVVGNNLANLNTPGFKTSTVSFQDLVAQSLGSGLGETQVGSGVSRPTTIREFTQGTIQSSSGLLDAAIQGDGFFVVKDATGAQLFTRAGTLMTDKQGNLMTATGEKVQGWVDAGTGTVDTNAPIGDIIVPVGTLKEPTVPKTVSVDHNLHAAAAQGTADDTVSTSVQVYDSIGEAHIVSFTFTKQGANSWDYSVSEPDQDFNAAFTAITGNLTFDESGHLQTPDATNPTVAIPMTGLADGAKDFTFNWNLYNGTTPRITQFAQTSSPSAVTQDGAPVASLVHVSLADGGKIIAQYSNKEQRVVGQMAMALVRNPESLLSVGNNNFALSATTALPAIGLPDSGGRGSIMGGSIESSNVDIAREFTNLIVFQRGYQANARVITAADEISQETINLKR